MRNKSHKRNVTIDDLAVMVAGGFERVEGRLGNVEGRLGAVEKDVKEIRGHMATKRDVLDIGDKFVPRVEFDRLLIRVGKIEQRLHGRAR